MITLSLLCSCLGQRYLTDDQTLLTKVPKITGIPSEYEKNMDVLIRQRPNKRIIGFVPITYLAQSYQTGLKNFDTLKYVRKIDETNQKYEVKISKAKTVKRKTRLTRKRTKKTDKFQLILDEGNLLMRIGEPLAIFDSSLHDQSARNMEQYLHAIGHFGSEVKPAYRHRRKKTEVAYHVALKLPYFIDSIQHQIPDPRIAEIVRQSQKTTHLKTRQRYDQSNIDRERNRLLNLLLNHGYYGLNRNQITYQVDTTSLGNRNIILTQSIQNPSGNAYKQYRIDSVIFINQVAGFSNSETEISTFNNIAYRFSADRYKKKVLDYRLFIRPDSLFNRQSALETQRQLSYLDAFKFVNINYDSSLTEGLVATVFTSPLSKYQTTNEVGFIQGFDEGQQYPSPFVNIGLKKRNAFGGLETLEVNGNFAILGISNVEKAQRRYSLFEYGGELRLTIPSFVLLTSDRLKRRIGSYNPKTIISTSYNYENRTTEYERSRFNTGISYLWRVRSEKQFTLTPLVFSFVNIPYISPSFQEFLDMQQELGNGSIVAAFQPTILSSTSFDAKFNNNQYGNLTSNSSYGSIFLETGGNLADLFSQRAFQGSNAAVFKWSKVNSEYRKMFIFRDYQIAIRFNLGMALSYGPEPSLPYEKRFYGGGSNSMRAWQVRRLGPGAFGEFNEPVSDLYPVATINYNLEQGGEMIIEANMEFRKNIISFLDYALFLEAGNIWIINDREVASDSEGDNGVFRFNSFHREFAVGGGIGLRFDFSFLVFRLDGGIQIVDPAQPLGNRFILNKMNLFAPINGTQIEKNIFANKTNLNIGIGLPF